MNVSPVEVGVPAWTDGVSIFVDPNASVRDVLCSVSVQASLLGSGSLFPDVAARLVRHATLTRRYLALEGHRALLVQEDVLPAAARALIDPGVAARIRSPADSLALAASREPIAEPPGIFGTIRPGRLRSVEARPALGVTAQHGTRQERDALLRELEHDDDSDATVVDPFSTSVGRGGSIGRLLKKAFGDARSRATGPPGVERATRWSKRSTPRASNPVVTAAAAALHGDVGAADHRQRKYPEWDVYRRRYRPDWCTAIEITTRAENGRSSALPESHALRRPLARLGLDLERRRRQLQGDDIDIDAAVEVCVQVAAGSVPDEAMYVDSIRSRRDLAVLVLLDVSGSAGEPGATGGTVHEHQRTAAAGLTAALHDLGDRVALYAFRSQGRAAVHFLPVKRFDDGFDALVRRRLGALVPGAYTRLGAAIRHSTSVLEADGGTSRRLLVVFSDGFAYDHGYEGTYGEADARRALAEARRRGTACLCISVGAKTDPAALRRVFGTAAHATLTREEQLASVVGPLFRAALSTADIQRRAWQRTERTRERLDVDRRTA